MTNLMGNQQIQTLGWKHVSNWAESTHASVRQLSGLNVTVLNDQVLCREQFGRDDP